MATIFDREYEPPEPTEGDAEYALVREVTDKIPGASLVLDSIFGAPFERRRREWEQEIAAAIRRLEQRGIHAEELRGNAAFLDAVAAASLAAIKTSQVGKRQALRNAILNAALPGAPDVTEQQIFLALTDRFTDKHLFLLALFHAPGQWRMPDGQPIRLDEPNPRALAVAERVFPDFKQRPDLYHKLWSDLYTEKLVRTAAIDNGYEGDWRTIRRTTELGAAYLTFITDPLG